MVLQSIASHSMVTLFDTSASQPLNDYANFIFTPSITSLFLSLSFALTIPKHPLAQHSITVWLFIEEKKITRKIGHRLRWNQLKHRECLLYTQTHAHTKCAMLFIVECMFEQIACANIITLAVANKQSGLSFILFDFILFSLARSLSLSVQQQKHSLC